VKQAVKWLLF